MCVLFVLINFQMIVTVDFNFPLIKIN